MDYTFLPFKAVILIVLLLFAGFGSVYCRKRGKWQGAFIGAVLGLVVISIIAFVAPVKLTTNTAAYTASQSQQSAERHRKIPAKVIVEVKTFEQIQADEEARSIEANIKLRDDLK